MRYRQLGKTGLRVSVIGFGAIKLPQISVEEATRVLNLALDLGINFIDTARGYRDSETKIGIALKDRRDEFYLATKTHSRDEDGAMKDIKTSLRELQTDYIDILQLHTVSSKEEYRKVMSPGGALQALKKARQKGLIGHIGITIHRDLDVMRWAIESGEFETIMLAYSPIDPEGVEREGILKLAKEYGLGVIIMKPLSGGQLVMPETEMGKQVGNDPIVRGCLRYILSNDAVSTVIPGMKRIEEVKENVSVAEMPIPMTEEEKRDLFKLIGSLGKSFRYGQTCLRCGYCLPCPQGIPIPEVFRAYDAYLNYPDEVKEVGLKIYASLEVKPDVCIECRECVTKCPAGIDIPTRLKEAAEVLERALGQLRS
ncbi:MAG: aldo/keto reductase [Thermoprotei archaeon]|nr:aldo/keto reductase [Thermoprotei archaeon]